nr:MAG TPA: hypothetical protein [Bacteriophage sp.]
MYNYRIISAIYKVNRTNVLVKKLRILCCQLEIILI